MAVPFDSPISSSWGPYFLRTLTLAYVRHLSGYRVVSHSGDARAPHVVTRLSALLMALVRLLCWNVCWNSLIFFAELLFYYCLLKINLYFRYEAFNRCVICKCFLPFHVLFIHFPNGIFRSTYFFKKLTMYNLLFYFATYVLMLFLFPCISIWILGWAC